MHDAPQGHVNNQRHVVNSVQFVWKQEWGGGEVFVIGDFTAWGELLPMEYDAEQQQYILAASLPVRCPYCNFWWLQHALVLGVTIGCRYMPTNYLNLLFLPFVLAQPNSSQCVHFQRLPTARELQLPIFGGWPVAGLPRCSSGARRRRPYVQQGAEI